MKNIKLLVSTVMVCAMGVFSALAQNDKVSYFNKEVSFSLGTDYTVDEGFTKQYDFNLDLQGSYSFNKYVSVDVGLPFYSNHDVAVDRVSAGLTLRVPISRIAPYASAGTEYLWGNKDFNYYGAGGIQFRINPKVGVFTEYRYKIQDFDNSSLKNGQGQIRAGFTVVL